jgi:hypothetical protein
MLQLRGKRTVLQHLPNTASVDDAVACLKEHGHVIIDDLVTPETMDRIESELKPYSDSGPFGESEALGILTRRSGALIARSPTTRNLVVHHLVYGAAKGFLSQAAAVQVSLTETIFLWPGSKAQALHQDELAYDAFPFGDYEVQLSTLWAMSDYSAEMGATSVVPGSHKAGRFVEFEQKDCVPAEMSRGSVMLYSGKIYHGSGENKSNKIRKAININYAVGWLRQEENQYLSCPPEIAKGLPEELLRAMGYQCAAAAGFVGDRKDPLSVILDEYRERKAVYSQLPFATPLTSLS